MPVHVTKQYRSLNTAIFVTCNCLIPFVDEPTRDAVVRGWMPTARLVITFFHLENVFKFTYFSGWRGY